MLPTIAEQLAAMHRAELREAAMMPYENYRLYQIERPKTAAELRLAHERTGHLAAAAAEMLQCLTRAIRLRRPAPKTTAPTTGVALPSPADMHNDKLTSDRKMTVRV